MKSIRYFVARGARIGRPGVRVPSTMRCPCNMPLSSNWPLRTIGDPLTITCVMPSLNTAALV